VAATAQPAAAEAFSPAARWLATLAVLSAFFTSIFTGTMVNVAVPDVMGAFGVGQGQAQFLSSTFLAMNTTGLLASSWVIGKLGQRKTFMFVMLGFAGASLVCYSAPTLEVLILGRVMQGFAAGILQPLVMLVLFQVFPMEKRGLAMGMFSMGVTVALGLGPSIGGMAIDAVSWRAIFLAPIPACMLAILLGALFLPPEEQRMPTGKFDLLGFGLINATVFCWFTMLGNGQKWGWTSDNIMLLALVAVLSGIAFVMSQKRPGASLLDLSLFRNAAFVAALVMSFLFGFGNFSSVYAFPIFGQIVQGFSPSVAGSMLLPGSLFAAAVLPLTGRVSDKMPAPYVMIFGLSIIAISMFMLAGADTNTVFAYIAFALLIGRVGSAFVSPALNTTAIGALSPAQMRRGAGVANLSLMLGGSTGISVFVILLEKRTEFHAVNLGATQTTSNSAMMEMLGRVANQLSVAGLPEAAQQGMAMIYLDRVVSAQAQMLGFQDGFVSLTMIALAPLIPVMYLLRLQMRRKQS
jgi:MFS transporter, DHA2 family, multidrug resistance protein